MMISTWPNINDKFYSYSAKPKENVVLTENLSGRVVGHKINSKDIMQMSCSIALTKEETKTFWYWFNNILGQTAGCFTCPAIGSNKYRFLSIPEPQDTDQTMTYLSLDIEEVF